MVDRPQPASLSSRQFPSEPSPMRLARFLALAAAVGFAPAARADVTPHPLFTEHMVLQRDTAVPVWGLAEPGEEVTVSLGTTTAKATADKDGKWLAKLPPQKAGTD